MKLGVVCWSWLGDPGAGAAAAGSRCLRRRAGGVEQGCGALFSRERDRQVAKAVASGWSQGVGGLGSAAAGTRV